MDTHQCCYSSPGEGTLVELWIFFIQNSKIQKNRKQDSERQAIKEQYWLLLNVEESLLFMSIILKAKHK